MASTSASPNQVRVAVRLDDDAAKGDERPESCPRLHWYAHTGEYHPPAPAGSGSRFPKQIFFTTASRRPNAAPVPLSSLGLGLHSSRAPAALTPPSTPYAPDSWAAMPRSEILVATKVQRALTRGRTAPLSRVAQAIWTAC